MNRIAALAGLLTMLSGCAPPRDACEGLPGSAGITAELFFGRTSRTGPIGDAEWQDFLARTVTPRFPDGLTVLEARGQWRQRASGRVISQPATMVLIAADRSPETLAKLEAIRAEYRVRFEQESVGLVTAPSCASF